MSVKRFLVGMICVLAPTCVGCEGVQGLWTKAKPETNIDVDPVARRIHVHNSKDCSVTLDEFYGRTKDGGEFKVKGLKVIDNASIVRKADAEQIAASVALTAEILRPLDNFLKLVAAKIPGGGSTGTTTTQPSQ